MERTSQTLIESQQFKHDDACPLFNPRHAVGQDVATVVEAFNESEGHKAVASGCNTCSSHAMHHNDDVDAYAYYVAQSGGNGEGVYFGYDSEATAYKLIGIAAQNGIEYEWDGDTSTKVLIGGSE